MHFLSVRLLDLYTIAFLIANLRYGEIMHVLLVRDRKTGKSKGYAFLQYEDQRSTILAVDNLNGATVSFFLFF